MKNKRWPVVRSTLIVNEHRCRVQRDCVRWPDGSESDYFISLRPDVVVACAITPECEVLLVEQYKHAVRARTVELPAGTLGEGEKPLGGARRELLEETGYRSSNWTKVGCLYDDSSRNNNRVHLFLARHARRIQDQSLDAGELAAGLSVSKCPIDEAMRLVRTGRIVSQSSVAGLLLCAGFLQTETRMT